MEDFYENVHSTGDRPICLGKLPALGAAGTPGEPTQQPRYSAKPSRRSRRHRLVRRERGSSHRTDESVNGELVNKLDSKTAKSGDSVVVQTKTSVKTPDGTEIPKGSKLVGHVIAVRPSQSGQNSQMALVFDRVELKGGKDHAGPFADSVDLSAGGGSIGQWVCLAQAAASNRARAVLAAPAARRQARVALGLPRSQRWPAPGTVVGKTAR